MANKTQPTDASVEDFLASVENPRRRADAAEVHAMMTAASGEPGVLWGTSIVGFGSRTYRTGAGREGEWFPLGFSPRKTSLVLYFMAGLDDDLLAELGKHKRGVGCLHVATLDDVDRVVLRRLIERSVAEPGAGD